MPHEVDDVPLLGEEQKDERPPQAGTGQRSTSPALAAGMAYPAQPQPQPQVQPQPQAQRQPQPYSGPVGGGRVGYGPPPVQYSAYPAPAPVAAQQQTSSNVVRKRDTCFKFIIAM